MNSFNFNFTSFIYGTTINNRKKDEKISFGTKKKLIIKILYSANNICINEFFVFFVNYHSLLNILSIN